MPDFNKGDFTQQGVAGHVNANLRLNEKRLVNIDLTSNEEAEGCTITGTVKDLLNDKVYAIGSGASGNIEITENGENINVAPYATATVNVAGGGGDLKYCEVTIVCSTPGNVTGQTPTNAAGILDLGSFQVNNGDKIKCYYTFDEVNIFATLGPQNPSAVCRASEHVNCTSVEEGAPYVLITDPTENSSFTLTVTNWGGGN